MIRKASSVNSNLAQALAEVSRELKSAEANLSLIFLGTDLGSDRLEIELLRAFGRANVVVCTTAGEISPAGIHDRSVCGVSFSADEFSVSVCEIEKVDEFSEDTMRKLRDAISTADEQRVRMDAAEVLGEALNEISGGDRAKSIALLFIDGLAKQEEYVASYLALLLKDIPLVGGSTGDNLSFDQTRIFFDGRVRESSAVVALLTTKTPFRFFKTQHFTKGLQSLVVTGANLDTRQVTEIDGVVAAEAYASAIGVRREDLTSEVFSAHPLVINIGGELYVRSIQQLNPDGSLTLYCSIEEGLVLSIANKQSLIEETENIFEEISRELQEIELSLFFECIHRRLEIESFSQLDRSRYLNFYSRVNAFGFYTYGEQFCGLHINQTLTGVAFGRPHSRIAR